MSNEAARHAREYLDLIKWVGQSWQSVTFKMLEGGNQVIETTPDYPAVYSDKKEGERRICGNLESPELAIFIACAPSALSNAAHEIENLEREMEKVKSGHKGDTQSYEYRISALSNSLKMMEESRDEYMDQCLLLQKKLARYGKKRAKKK